MPPTAWMGVSSSSAILGRTLPVVASVPADRYSRRYGAEPFAPNQARPWNATSDPYGAFTPTTWVPPVVPSLAYTYGPGRAQPPSSGAPMKYSRVEVATSCSMIQLLRDPGGASPPCHRCATDPSCDPTHVEVEPVLEDGPRGRPMPPEPSRASLPGSMSVTSLVPAAVPSLFHSSPPWMPSLAARNSLPWNGVRLPGDEPLAPSRMSLTSLVPADVPSVFHSSRPWTPSSAMKNSVEPTTVRLLGCGARRAGRDVPQPGRGGRGRDPQLDTVRVVPSREHDTPQEWRQFAGTRAARRVDVPDERRRTHGRCRHRRRSPSRVVPDAASRRCGPGHWSRRTPRPAWFRRPLQDHAPRRVPPRPRLRQR